MEIIQRGIPSIMKSIAQKSKQVSESKGVVAPIKSKINVQPTLEGGAYASMMKRKSNVANTKVIVGVDKPLYSKGSDTSFTQQSAQVFSNESVLEKTLMSRLMESVETLEYNKEYSNAVSSLFTLYSMDKLTESVLSSITEEDLSEIKAIVREFSNILDR